MSSKACYRALVVEDELPILDNLVEKLESADLPLQVVGTAADGEQALELVGQLLPDILFTDIRMPVMDGLTLIESARKLLPTLRTVIISGYSDFEYAQRAIQYGVTDYLLKPVSRADIETVGRRLCDSLTEYQMTQERQVIAAQLSGSGTEHPPSDFADRRFVMYLICLGSMYDRCYEALDREVLSQHWELLNLPQLLPCITPQERWWLVGEKLPNCRMLITTAPETPNSDMVYKEMSKRLDNHVAVTVCGTGNPLLFCDIWQTAQRLRKLLQGRLIPGVSQFLTVQTKAEPEQFFPTQQQLFGSLLSSCRLGQLQPFTESLREFLACCRTGRVTQLQLEGWLLRLADELDATAQNAIDTTTLQGDLLESIATASSPELLYTTLQALLRNCATHAYQTPEGIEELAGRVHRYIDEHYLEPITMDSISGKFHFSCSYITRIFKKEYGTPPFRYLLGLRISEAKRMIAYSDSINISLIAQSVGYDDQHYFSRIFKNITGLSPSEYKKQCHREVSNG